jgi:hypothetical protein
MPNLLNRREAAATLRISQCALDLYVRSEQIKPVRIGSRVLFTEKELERFVRAQQKEPRGCRA